MSEFDLELDARGLNCPLPIVRAKKSLDKLQIGQVLRVIATDPGSVKDFEVFCSQTGHELLSVKQQADEFQFQIRKGLEKKR